MGEALKGIYGRARVRGELRDGGVGVLGQLGVMRVPRLKPLPAGGGAAHHPGPAAGQEQPPPAARPSYVPDLPGAREPKEEQYALQGVEEDEDVPDDLQLQVARHDAADPRHAHQEGEAHVQLELVVVW